MTRVAFWTVLAALALAGCTSGASPASHTAGSRDGVSDARSSAVSGTASEGCRTEYTPRPLPAWANVGFDPATQPMPYVLGDRGDIVAILWAIHDPLVVPPAADRNNKILWVSRVGSPVGAPLRIEATLTATGQRASRTVDRGPGPSLIDLPSPGCWSFELTWGKNHDHLQLEYASG